MPKTLGEFWIRYCELRFRGLSPSAEHTFKGGGLPLFVGWCLAFLVFGLLFYFWGWYKGFPAFLFFNLFLAFDALHALILALHSRAWNRTVTRERDADGVNILANAKPCTLQGGSGIAVLFVHGLGDTPETWQLIAPRVHELANATCRAMRLPFTSTPLRRQHHATLDNWLDAIRGEVASLRRCHKHVFIAGHSLGAGLALLAARDDSKLADGVIAFSPFIRAKRVPAILFWLADHFCVFTRACPNPFPDAGTTTDGRVYPYARDRFAAFAVLRAVFQMTRRLNTAQTRGRVTGPLPVLAFVSLRDRLVDLPSFQRLIDGADIFTTRKAGHVLTLDAGWEKRARRIAEFIPSSTGEGHFKDWFGTPA